MTDIPNNNSYSQKFRRGWDSWVDSELEDVKKNTYGVDQVVSKSNTNGVWLVVNSLPTITILVCDKNLAFCE